jgi:uncharacterized SAM-binding protein YcdF (DUF218 family)
MPVTPIGWLRLAIKVAVVGGLLVLVYLVVIFVQVWQASRVDDRRTSDAIVVLGAAQYDGRPSPQLAARLDHVVELWKAKIAPRVVVTGGKQPGDRFTEAAASAAYLHKRGIPESAILREVQGRTSWESLQAAALILHDRHLNRVTLVSDPYHDARIRDIAEDVGLDAVVSPTHTSPVRGLTELHYLLKETVRVAAGRIIGYSRLERHGRIGELVPGLGIMFGLPRRSRLRVLALAAPIRG